MIFSAMISDNYSKKNPQCALGPSGDLLFDIPLSVQRHCVQRTLILPSGDLLFDIPLSVDFCVRHFALIKTLLRFWLLT